MERFRNVKLEQPENIPLMFVTLAVLKLEILSSFKPAQPENIQPMFVTLEVLKLETLSSFKLEQ